MPKSVLIPILVLVMILIIVGLDVTFFRDHFWERLVSNIVIVLVFLVLYFSFLK